MLPLQVISLSLVLAFLGAFVTFLFGLALGFIKVGFNTDLCSFRVFADHLNHVLFAQSNHVDVLLLGLLTAHSGEMLTS